LNVLGFICSLIAIFVPWSWKDTAVFVRSFVGLWQNCNVFTNNPLNAYTCWENDVDQVGSIAGGSSKCRGYVVATQVFTVSGVVFSFLAFALAGLILGKLWSKPIALGLYVCVNAFLSFSTCMIAFLMWIVYAQTDCQPGNPLFPLVGYSWGWILMVVATTWTFFGMIFAYVGLFSILKFKPFIPHEEPPMYPVAVEAQPFYPDVIAPIPSPYLEPVAYPAAVPVAYPAPAFGGVY